MLRNGFEKLENGMINEGLAMLGGWPTSGVLRRLARAGPKQKLPGGTVQSCFSSATPPPPLMEEFRGDLPPEGPSENGSPLLSLPVLTDFHLWATCPSPQWTSLRSPCSEAPVRPRCTAPSHSLSCTGETESSSLAGNFSANLL